MKKFFIMPVLAVVMISCGNKPTNENTDTNEQDSTQVTEIVEFSPEEGNHYLDISYFWIYLSA